MISHRTTSLATRAVVHADVAPVEHLIKGIRQCRYQEKHREGLTQSKNKLLGSKVWDKKIRGREQRARIQSGRGLSERRLNKGIEAVQLGVL